MGLFSRLKDKVKAGLGAAKEEANHPGRPPSHRVDHNVFHREGSDRDEAARVAKAAADPTRKKNAGEDKPWYLDGENDGWDDVNVTPDEKPKNG
ncbi:MAG: hypothetical protein Q7U06_02365 [Pseudomonadota bacterium]|nr:hypothetical protein [Pseudomonadota bacterium]